MQKEREAREAKLKAGLREHRGIHHSVPVLAVSSTA